MSLEAKTPPDFEIAHILFIDTVGYSKLLIDGQKKVLAELNLVVKGTESFRAAEGAGKLIRLPTGDGMALVFSEDPQAPAKCALEVARAVKQAPDLPLRMGIHSGPISRVVDVNDRVNVAGTGINMAQRVMNCGDPGHILLSKRTADDLAQHEHWRACLYHLGECEVKHGVKVELVNLFTQDLGNPETPIRIKEIRQENLLRLTAMRAALRRRIVTAALVVLAVLALSAVVYRVYFGPVVPKGPSPKSIAVLPFENLSDDKQNAYFTEGVQDEILTKLSKVADLKVISRTSVMPYRTGSGRKLRQIAEELGVAHILEGTVQRSGGRVKISAQLIDARSDTHIWANSFDRDLADVFAMQSEVAETIVEQLKARLSSAEKAAIEERPTSDLVAYDRFVRAKGLIESTVFSAREKESLFEAVRLLEEAVMRDPAFLLAYCQLARTHDKIYILELDHTAARVGLAEASIAQAVRLRPDSGEVHLAIANHLYCSYLDYDGARRELVKATELLPNEPLCFELTGFIDRRQGHWEESILALGKALELDPRNVYLLHQMSLTYEHMRRFKKMAEVLDRAVAIAPHDVNTQVARAIVDLEWRADSKPLHLVIERAIAQDPKAGAELAEGWFYLALCERDWAAAERAMTVSQSDACRIENVAFPSTWCTGLLARFRRDAPAARAAFSAALAENERVIRAQPNYGEAYCVRGMIEAALGEKAKAIENGERAVQLVPMSRDAINGPLLVEYLAIIYSWVGEKDRAIQQLRLVSKTPSTVNYGDLRLHPHWDELRNDPRFQEIVSSLAPK